MTRLVLATMIVTACGMAFQASLVANDEKETYSKTPLPAWSPPKAIPIFVPPDKPGFRELPGFGGKEFRYTYDVHDSKGSELRLLQFEQSIFSKDAFRRRSRWFNDIYSVKRDDLLPIAGNLYKWDGKRMVSFESDLAPQVEMDRGMAVINRLNVSRSDGKRLQLDIIKFGEKDQETVQAQVWGADLRFRGELVREANPTLWFKVGDRVKSTAWELKLHRIVRPDPNKKVQGWAEFEIEELQR